MKISNKDNISRWSKRKWTKVERYLWPTSENKWSRVRLHSLPGCISHRWNI